MFSLQRRKKKLFSTTQQQRSNGFSYEQQSVVTHVRKSYHRYVFQIELCKSFERFVGTYLERRLQLQGLVFLLSIETLIFVFLFLLIIVHTYTYRWKFLL